jgi:hypothetical protein
MNTKASLEETLKRLAEDIKAEICCCKIGRIEKFYADTKTADISIPFKRKVLSGELVDNPFILNVPIMGNLITLPITVGEYCIVLFNDFDLDLWYETGHSGEPATPRKHNITDAVAITGLNGLFNKILYDNEHINLNFNTIINGTQETTEDTTFNKNVTININLNVGGNVNAVGEVAGGTLKAGNGASGSFADTGTGASGMTLTIVDGIITNIG